MTEFQFKKNIYTFDTLDSTNNFCQKLIREKNWEEGVVIHAKEQSSGRGQGKNTWFSEKDLNLTFSLMVRPDFLPIQKHFFLSVINSLAVMDALKEFGIDASVKWPNDIYVGEKKIAGILIENALQGENILHSVAGIGINVNQDNFPDWIPNPTSMKILTGRPFEVREVLNAFLKAYWEYYFMLKDQQFQNLRQHYLDHLYRYESWGIYWSAGKTFKGMITGIEDNGLLCMKNLKGKTLKFAFKEVEFIH